MPVDIVDLTDMQKRGIIKKTSQNTDVKNEFVSLSPQAASQPAQSSPSPFDFLDNLASSAPQQSASNTDIQSLQNKIEDLEYKLERLVDKIVALESRLNAER